MRARVGERATTSEPVKGRHGLRRQPRDARSPDRALPRGHGDRQWPGQPCRSTTPRSTSTLEGTLDMAPLVEWAPPPVPVSGAGTFTGTMTGPLARNEIRLAFRAPALASPGPTACRSTATSRSPRRERWSSGSAWLRRGRRGLPTGRARSRAARSTPSAPAPSSCRRRSAMWISIWRWPSTTRSRSTSPPGRTAPSRSAAPVATRRGRCAPRAAAVRWPAATASPATGAGTRRCRTGNGSPTTITSCSTRCGPRAPPAGRT